MKIFYNMSLLLLLFPLAIACNEASGFSESPGLPYKVQSRESDKPAAPLMVFRSADGGRTWQDISKGLPENLREESIRGNSIFANDKGLFIKAGNGLYYSEQNAISPFWTKKIFSDKQNNMATGNPAILYWGVNLKKTSGENVWSPIFENLGEPRIRSVFETAGGIIFIGTDRGLFKTADDGKTWSHVYAGGLVGNLAESNGVLLATSMRKIIRSTDNGESWAPANSEDSMAYDVKPIKGGFAAITSPTESDNRRLSTSYDEGKTWQSIHSGLKDKVVIDSIQRTWDDRPHVQASMVSIVSVGEDFFCTHPEGIFKSSDKGQTWKLIFPLPSIYNKVFQLSVSGNVIYVIPRAKGC